MTVAADQLPGARRPRPHPRPSSPRLAGRIVDEYPVGYLAQLARPLAAKGERDDRPARRERGKNRRAPRAAGQLAV